MTTLWMRVCLLNVLFMVIVSIFLLKYIYKKKKTLRYESPCPPPKILTHFVIQVAKTMNHALSAFQKRPFKAKMWGKKNKKFILVIFLTIKVKHKNSSDIHLSYLELIL